MFWYFGQEACEILAPWPGVEPTPPALESEVLGTGLQGKSRLFPFSLYTVDVWDKGERWI